MDFQDFGLHESVLESIDAMGFDSPTPIQEKAIPPILEGRDIIACAQTGTGKTAAFLLPILHKLIGRDSDAIDTIVIVPTRELALQIDQQLEGFRYFTGGTSYAIYGGGEAVGFEMQKKAITSGVDIIVATPGRMLSHLNLGYVNTDSIKHIILDEADRMLDMGFFEDIMRIMKDLPDSRQTLLFSATMPSEIRKLSSKILKDPVEVNIAISKPAERVLQAAYLVYNEDKNDLVKHLLSKKDLPSVLIFCSTKSAVKSLEKDLERMNFNVKAIHSDLDQEKREEVMLAFRNRSCQILVATDIVSRGIDIDNINLVINYDVPSDPEDYIHRIGRTARASSDGVGLTFINKDDQPKFGRIEKLLESKVQKLKLPSHIKEGPEYKPFDKSHRRKNFKPRFKKKKR